MPFLREKGEERYSPFSLFPFLPFPTTLLPSVSPPLPSFLLFLFHPSPPPLFPFPSNFIPLFLLSFLPSSPSFKICESYPPSPLRFIVSYSLLFPFPFVYLSSVSPPPPFYFTHEYAKEYLASIWKKEKSCAPDWCGKK